MINNQTNKRVNENDKCTSWAGRCDVHNPIDMNPQTDVEQPTRPRAHFFEFMSKMICHIIDQ